MSDVYIVMTSNCEPYEDYMESIDSTWSTREAAIRRIEDGLGMHQVDWLDPARKWSRDRWLVEHPDYPRPEDFAGDPEGWEDCFDENGELLPYWVYSEDAWIVQLPVDRVPDKE